MVLFKMPETVRRSGKRASILWKPFGKDSESGVTEGAVFFGIPTVPSDLSAT